MTLTEEQREAILRGGVVSVEIEGTRCVLLREDVFSDQQPTEQGPRATYAAVLKALDRNDVNIDQYLDCLNESR